MILALLIIVWGFVAGCTSSSSSDVAVPPDPVTAATGAPLKDIKHPELLFTLQVPVEWNVISYKLNTAGIYQTDLVENNVFYIKTYTASGSTEAASRDQFRNWSPSPTETTVTMNEITYDRFESTIDGNTSVAYVAHTSSANELKYASVIAFVADTGNRSEKEDFEKIVASFRYFSGSDASTMPGEEITRTNRPSSAGSSSGGCGCRGL
jgi:hypothetical protein